ncbi:recombinase family protein [Bremerella sp. P1]|uniref:recombinase family protein n=1 Tax=Bremerella sp. P1 TaxID=3026424 RepID=UPI002368C965|nr:recombinase family protein [Bremerella sp. P1]WDI43703.1 recombinase family protein [Bremerella sp. P1]
MKRYLALARVSSREQEREGFSLDIQIDGLQRYAEQNNGEIIRMFRIAETATKSDERKVFGELLAYAKKHADLIDAVLFYKVDRAARNLKDFIALEELESDYDISFISVTQATDNTPSGRMMRRTLANMAAFYTEQQSLDVREGLARRVESGLFVSRAPFGYRNVREQGRGLIETDWENAAKVQRIFELYAFDYVSGEDIPERLEDEGVVWITSKPKFSVSKVYSILADRSYIGEVKFRGKWHPGTHESLVDCETWARAQVLLGRKSYRSHSMTYAGNLIKCGYCDRPISGEIKTKQTRSGEARYAYYRCARYTRPGHPRVRVREEQLDFQVGLILARLHSWFEIAVPQWVRKIAEAKAEVETTEVNARMKELKRQMSLAGTQQEQLLNLRIEGEISKDDFVAKKSEIEKRVKLLREAISEFEAQQREPLEQSLRAHRVFGKLGQLWNDSDFTFKRRVLELLFDGFVLHGTRLVPRYRTPLELFLTE